MIMPLPKPSKKHPSRHKRSSRRGFVLLAALVLMLLALLLLSSIARYSMSVATQAHDAQQELQRRWGAFSLRNVVLSRPSETLTNYLRASGKKSEDCKDLYPLKGTIQLGPFHYQLTLDDETRKINLNRLYADGGESPTRLALLELRQGITAVRLCPYQNTKDKSLSRSFESWGQVYALESLPTKMAAPDWLAANTQSATCWGNGSVNLRICSDHVLELLVRNAVNPIVAGRLVDLRRQKPLLNLDQLLDQLTLREKEKSQLQGWLTEHSDCFSLWIRMESSEASQRELSVVEMVQSGPPHVYHFVW